MADIVISLKISSDKVQKALEGFTKIYPNDEKILGEDGYMTETPKYSNSAWVSEKIRRLIVKDIKRGLGMIRQEEVQQVQDTNDMITTT